ncbi:DUF2911 domain-containing protein [Algoriphagus lacus]|uniref:DUF2911 domain-containing protein n=2 Tax=Algoriphagus lacus TaxID=2056311 RepID=A0A418PSZ6_9BACT|nr:DUF2911 domain-containing protein [Algoriphagus lacus]
MILSNPSQAQHEHHTNSPQAQQDTIKGSIQREVHQLVGENHFTLNYYAPAVRGRMIWGGLVAYDQVWVTGAHRATNVEFTQAIRIDGKVIPAGKYAIFTIPEKKKWILILNTRWDQHLADEYNAAEDVIRLEVKPEKSKEFFERLTYEIQEVSPEEGTIVVSWEKVSVHLDFTNVN